MNSAFTITPVEKGIMRCRHTASMSHEDVQALASFLYDYDGKLLVDLTEADPQECAKNLANFRPMMPTTAIFGADIDPAVLEIPDSYYVKDVRHFKTEDEALAWLREQ
jgi:hypothetical protein